MFTGSHIVISDGSFVQTNFVPAAENRGFNLFTEASSPSAFHNAGHQFDLPNNCYSNAAVIDRIKDWISDDIVPVMWLYGAAGVGKSSVARSIAVWCERESLLLASFFFSRSDPSRDNVHRFVPTLAYSVIQSIPESRHLIEQAIDSDPHILSRSLDAQISHLILRPLLTIAQNATGHAFPHVLVIDGLDECQDETAQNAIVRLFSSIFSSWNFRWKVLLTSRPAQTIRMLFDDAPVQYLSTCIAPENEYKTPLPDSNPETHIIRMPHKSLPLLRPQSPKTRKSELTSIVDPLADIDMEMVSTTPTAELSEAERRAFDKLEKSIAISAYHDSNERSASSGCLKSTREDQINTIMNWIESEGEKKPAFLVLGPAGSGKTSLLNTIADICKRKGYYAAGFFFSGTDSARNTTERLMNTIVYQVAVAIPQLQPYIARIIATDSTILSRSLDSKIITLLLEPLHQLRSDFPSFSPDSRSFVIVVDALDECGRLEEQRRVIAALAEVLSDRSFPLMCLLSSRFNPHIEHEIATTLTGHIQDQVILGKNSDAERADIRAYLHASVGRIRKKHAFGKRIPKEWPSETDLEMIVKRSGGQFIYASTVIRYVESPDHNPRERLRDILGIYRTRSGEDPFAELDALYRALMSSVKDISAASEILGIELIRSSSQFWAPRLMKFCFDFEERFCSLDGDIVLAPLASVLKYKDGRITFYHLSFAEFLLDSTRSREYFVQPMNWQKWSVSWLVPFFYDPQCRLVPFSLLFDALYLIDEAKPGTDLHQAIDDGIALVTDHPKCLPSGGHFNIWPFVTRVFFDQLRFYISIDKMPDIFIQRGENFLPLPVLIKLAPTASLSNSFLLFELCWTFAELQRSGLIEPLCVPRSIRPLWLSPLITYLADYLDDQHRLGQEVLLPNDYLSASLRCLWYLQSSNRNIRSSLMEQLSRFDSKGPQYQLGTFEYLNDTSSNLTCGALDALPLLLPHATPSIGLLAALKRPFDTEVLLRTPSSSHKALCIIQDYLVQHDPEYQQGTQADPHISADLASEIGQDEPLPEFEEFLYRKGT